ncbi:MAG TPA: aminotransferase class V-fold PLP-dependent enzyme, partial [Candidatus Acidoferrum sp.]|nr:aminotransferase class V-fold PLP-dependent enzyme [Candidatus Acidoferrum sp.]
NLGHLADLCVLDDTRLYEFLSGSSVLSAADPTNHSTETAGHDRIPIALLLERLRTNRLSWVRRLEALSEDEVAHTAVHPRLKRPLRLLDWAYFVAEHDDHHLALARQAILHAARSRAVEGGSVLSTAPPPQSATSGIAPARELFEMPDGVTYLNCANMAPQLRSVTAAGIDAVRAKATPWTLSARQWFSGAEELRRLAAQVIGADADGVALVPAVSYGIATAAGNLPLAGGQTIVVLDQEFPSNVYTWRELAKKKDGRVLTVLRKTGENWTEALLRMIDDTTAIVAVPHCHWTDGSKVDLELVAERTRGVGAALVIDASQSLGASVLDLERVKPDFLTAVGYKWLLGPYGLGYLYVAPKWRESGVALEQSWLTRAGSEDFTRLVDYTDEYRAGARRFDMGEFPQFVLVPMAIAALKQILAWGVGRIEQTLAALTEQVAQLAAESNYSVLPAADRSANMIGIRPPRGIPAELPEALKQANVFVSIRGNSIRIAPHLYNESKDIDLLFEVLRRVSS